MKKSLLLCLVFFLAIPILGMAKPGKNGKLKVKPSTVDPDHLHLVVAAWMRRVVALRLACFQTIIYGTPEIRRVRPGSSRGRSSTRPGRSSSRR